MMRISGKRVGVAGLTALSVILVVGGVAARPTAVEVYEADQVWLSHPNFPGFGDRPQLDAQHVRAKLDARTGAWLGTVSHGSDGIHAEQPPAQELRPDLTYVLMYEHRQILSPRIRRRIAGQECSLTVGIGTGKANVSPPDLPRYSKAEVWTWTPVNPRVARALGPLRIMMYGFDEKGELLGVWLCKDTVRVSVPHQA